MAQPGRLGAVLVFLACGAQRPGHEQIDEHQEHAGRRQHAVALGRVGRPGLPAAETHDARTDGDEQHAAYEQALEDAAANLAEDESFLELPEAEMNQKIGETVMEATAAIEPVDAGSVTIDYTLEGSTWTPTEQSTRNIAEVLFG